MSNYSIKDLETITGIKAHTIRIWEQRYEVLEPNRTDTNIRLYCEEDLKHLLNLSLLNKNGYRISKLSSYSREDVRKIVLKLTDSNHDFGNQIDALILAMITFNEESFDKILGTNILRIGFEETFLNIIFPFLQRIGILWQTEVVRPAQEHFISNLIRQKIIVAIDGQVSTPNYDSKRFILFLPEQEMHEISLLFINYLLKSRNNLTIYLGANVPMEDLGSVMHDFKADYILTFITSITQNGNVLEYINQLSNLFPDKKIVCSGRQLMELEEPTNSNVIICKHIDDTLQFINQHNYKHKPLTSGMMYNIGKTMPVGADQNLV